MTTATTTTYTKLRDGSWGLRGSGLRAGDRVTVTKRDGSTKREVVGKVLWQGEGVALATIAASHARSTYSRPRRSSGTWTGCRCGSVEEYERPGDCRSCQHDR